MAKRLLTTIPATTTARPPDGTDRRSWPQPLVVLAVAAACLTVLPVLMVVVVLADHPVSSGPGAALNTTSVPAAYVAWIDQAGALCPQITAPLLAAQLKLESGFNPNASSPAGAEGIAQFMPGTWPSWSGPPAVPGPDVPTNPADAIMAQGRFMCALAAQAAASGITTASITDLALAGYNAGWGAVAAAGGIPPNAGTEAYVTLIDNTVPTFTLALVATPSGGSGVSSGALANLWPTVYAFLLAQVGKPYVWGATGPNAYDCSGLVLTAYHQVGVNLPRTSQAQWTATQASAVPYTQAQPGDLLFFEGNPPGHVAIYIGGGNMVQAPYTGANVDVIPVPVGGLLNAVATVP